jgi:hypothetical protein
MKSHAVRSEAVGIPGVSGEENVIAPARPAAIREALAKLPGVVPAWELLGSEALTTGMYRETRSRWSGVIRISDHWVSENGIILMRCQNLKSALRVIHFNRRFTCGSRAAGNAKLRTGFPPARE